jgi:hypothetical protein
MTTKQDTIREELERHPELTPIMETDTRGNIVCLGWVSPIYTFNREFLEDMPKEGNDEK